MEIETEKEIKIDTAKIETEGEKIVMKEMIEINDNTEIELHQELKDMKGEDLLLVLQVHLTIETETEIGIQDVDIIKILGHVASKGKEQIATMREGTEEVAISKKKEDRDVGKNLDAIETAPFLEALHLERDD